MKKSRYTEEQTIGILFIEIRTQACSGFKPST